jgi:Zn-dependent protease
VLRVPPPRAITVARVHAIEITLNWRWAPALALGTWLLAQNVFPARFPAWEAITSWLTAFAVVLAGEVALLLHELGHALMAHGRGHEVRRIVFHGFHAETVCSESAPDPSHEALIALAGPAVNATLAIALEALRVGLATQGPVDVALVLLLIGNVAMALMSLVPLGWSDGGRAVNALVRARSSGCPSGRGSEQ